MDEVYHKTFALIGVGGFVAPRHLRAIHEVGGTLIAAADPHDSVGILDGHFPEARYFSEIERFDRFLDKERRAGRGVDYVSVCTPNYLHDAHCRLSLRAGADVICEKPLVLSPWNLDQLAELEAETGGRIYTVLQLRLHPKLIALRKEVSSGNHDVSLTYATRRGNWYHHSWKGREDQSGGLATNIGIHFFDLLLWLFGPDHGALCTMRSPSKMVGTLSLERAEVRWKLSIDAADFPEHRGSYRSMTINGAEVDFSSGIETLHTRQYQEVLEGRGFGIEDARPAIELVHRIRNMYQ